MCRGPGRHVGGWHAPPPPPKVAGRSWICLAEHGRGGHQDSGGEKLGVWEVCRSRHWLLVLTPQTHVSALSPALCRRNKRLCPPPPPLARCSRRKELAVPREG